MKKSRLLCAVCPIAYRFISMLLFLISSVGQAAPVHYDEATDGELTSTPILLAFDIGANTVSGSSSWLTAGQSNGIFDYDYFNLQIQPNQILESVILDYMLGSSLSTQFHINWSIIGVPGSYDFVYIVSSIGSPPVGPNPATMHENVLPLTAGIFSIRNGAGRKPDESPWDTYWSYTLTYNVAAQSPIPLPPAVWLFGSGLLGVIGISSRKKTT